MATALRNLTKMGTDVKQIARLLQKKAPPGHMLAYISPEEAEALKQRGGSGRITDEGIPSFEEEPTGFGETPAPSAPITTGGEPTGFGQTPFSTATGGGDTISAAPAPAETSVSAAPSEYSLFGGGGGGGQPGIRLGTPSQLSLALPSDVTPSITTPSGPSPYDITSKTASTLAAPGPEVGAPPAGGMSDATKAKLGISGLEALLGASQVRAAQSQGQAAKEALQAQAAPYQQQGQQLLAASQRGELTPANQQILQAQQAQAAQNVATRGGVGAQQAQNQINALSQQLLQSQLNLGLQLQSVGDKIAQGAIQAGVQADQYVNNLTSSYAMNIARTLAGGLPGGTTTTPTPQQ